jgi:hypothetical protein
MLSQPRNSKFEELGTLSGTAISEIVFNVLFIIFVSCVFLGQKRSLLWKKKVRHHHDEQMLYLKLSLAQTRHQMRIVKLQPAIKVR